MNELFKVSSNLHRIEDALIAIAWDRNMCAQISGRLFAQAVVEYTKILLIE